MPLAENTDGPTERSTLPAAATPARSGRVKQVARAALALIAIGALFLIARRAGGALPEFAAWVDSLGALGPLVFVAGYMIATVAFIPGSLLTLAGGAIFGVAQGTLWVFLGASLGAVAAFLVARYVARGAVERRVARNPRFAALDEAIARQGRKIVFLLRLSPVFPFVLLNYALGLTKVRLADYALACAGMLPGTLLYVYYGKVVGDVAALAAGAAPERGPADYALLGLGLAATIVVTTIVTRIATRALRETTALGDPATTTTPATPAT